MRVVFLYTSYGAAGSGAYPPWDSSVESNNHFVGVHGLPTEGYFRMLCRLKDLGIIDDLIIFIESNRSPGSKTLNGVSCYVVPRIEYVEEFLKEGDVIFVRGGFRGWYDPFLLKMKAQKRWLLCYAANTGRQRWIIWDIVFSDLITQHQYDRRGRFWFFFRKPVDPTVFYRMGAHLIKRDIDICIGASKIHDKKGQWRTINALIEHKRMSGKTLKCIMPGAIRRGVETSKIVSKITQYSLDVEMPGFVDRYELNKIYNRSKVFIHLGNSGENDRGPLEATSVGCSTILGGVTRHAPFLRSCRIGILVSKETDNSIVVANEIDQILGLSNEGLRDHIVSYFDEHNGFESKIIPDMKRLFGVIRKNPVPSLEALKKEYNL